MFIGPIYETRVPSIRRAMLMFRIKLKPAD
jgi:hypothetical protein